MSYVFAKSASNYEIPRESCIYIIENYEGFSVGFSRELRDKLAWVGLDQAGNYIEIVAIDFIYYWYVFDEIKKRLK